MLPCSQVRFGRQRQAQGLGKTTMVEHILVVGEQFLCLQRRSTVMCENLPTQGLGYPCNSWPPVVAPDGRRRVLEWERVSPWA